MVVFMAYSCGEGTIGDDNGGEGEGEGGDDDLSQDEDGDESGDEDDGLSVVVDGDKAEEDGDDVVIDGDEPDGDDIADGDETVDGDDVEPDGDDVVLGDGFRMDYLELVDPYLSVTYGNTTYDISAELNNQIANRIASDEINMLMLPQAYDGLLSFPYDLVIAVGEKEGEAYTPDPESAYQVEIDQYGDDPNRFSNQEDLEIEIPIDPPDMVLTLRNATIRGTYSEDLTSIGSGTLAGVISEEDAQNLIIYNGITLKQVLTWLSVFPDPAIGGYRFEFAYTGEDVKVR